MEKNRLDLEMYCRDLVLARIQAECLRALTIVDAPRLSVQAWSHRTFALRQAAGRLHGAIWRLHDAKQEIKTFEELKALGF